MTKIDSLDRDSTKIVQDRFLQALQAVAEELGLRVRAHGGSIEAGSATLKFRVECLSPTASAATRDHQNKMLGLLGLPDAYGKKFVYGHDLYTVMEASLGSPKFPVIAATAYGRRRKFTVGLVQKQIAEFAGKS